jgi:hypothetical protein
MANYLGSSASTLPRGILDHNRCFMSISTDIPKAKIFSFENYWMLHDDFMHILQHGSNIPVIILDKAKRLGGYSDLGIPNYLVCLKQSTSILEQQRMEH